MKEATGELNMTLSIVVAIAALAAFFYTMLWPVIKNTFIATSKCGNAVCDVSTLSDGLVSCKYYDKNGVQQGTEFKCVFKG